MIFDNYNKASENEKNLLIMCNEESKESKTDINKNQLTIDDPFEITKRLKHSTLTNNQLKFKAVNY